MNEESDQQEAARRARAAQEDRERGREIAETDHDRKIERAEKAEAQHRRRERDDICGVFVPEQRRPVEGPRR